jgi:hypothetical protein
MSEVMPRQTGAGVRDEYSIFVYRSQHGTHEERKELRVLYCNTDERPKPRMIANEECYVTSKPRHRSQCSCCELVLKRSRRLGSRY